MRAARPELIGIVRPLRIAAAWALACSGLAAVLGLALPILALHVVAVVERKSSLDALALVAVVCGFGLIGRASLLAVRARLMTSAALWFDHVAGEHVLTHGLVTGLPPNVLAAERQMIAHGCRNLSSLHLTAALDAPFVIFPLITLFLIHPSLAVVSLVTAVVMLFSALRLVRAIGPLQVTADAASDAADGAWRTAAAASVVIQARDMTAGVVHDWQSLNARAISGSYRVAQRSSATGRMFRLYEAVAGLALLLLGAWLAQTEGLSVGHVLVALLLQTLVTRTLSAAAASIPELAQTDRTLAVLSNQRRPVASHRAAAMASPVGLPATGMPPGAAAPPHVPRHTAGVAA
jgi:ATP-binding cassette, subfamily C, bacterial LapB